MNFTTRSGESILHCCTVTTSMSINSLGPTLVAYVTFDRRFSNTYTKSPHDSRYGTLYCERNQKNDITKRRQLNNAERGTAGITQYRFVQRALQQYHSCIISWSVEIRWRHRELITCSLQVTCIRNTSIFHLAKDYVTISIFASFKCNSLEPATSRQYYSYHGHETEW